MKKQENSNHLKLASLETTFYLIDKERRNVETSSAADFDSWASLFVEEIVNVKRDIWDIFARWKFINWLLDEGRLQVQIVDDGVLLLEVFSSSQVEEKTSSTETENVDASAQEAS